MDDDAGRGHRGSAVRARPRLIERCRPSRQSGSGATPPGAGSTWSWAVTTSTTWRSSSRGRPSCASSGRRRPLRRGSPRAGPRRLPRPGRARQRPVRRAHPGHPVDWAADAVTPGWVLRDHVGHLADWAEGGGRRHRRLASTWALAGRPGRRRRPLERAARRGGARRRGNTGRDPGPLRREARGAARRPRHAERRGPALPGRLVVGLRLPVRAHPQAPGHARPVVCGPAPSRLSGRRRRAAARRLTIKSIVAVEGPREFRIRPRDRVVAYTAELAGARQLCTLSLRGSGAPVTQLTASEQSVSDPQWSPDGRRLAYVRDGELWVAGGRRVTRDARRGQARRRPGAALVTGRQAPRLPVAATRLEPGLDDRRPVPRRGRPQRDPRAPQADRPDRGRHRRPGHGLVPRRGEPRRRRTDPARRPRRRCRSLLVDAATGASQVIAGQDSHDTGPRWSSGRSLVYFSDAFGLVPGRATDAGRSRAHRPDRRGARARRAVRGPGLRRAAVARRQPGRPHRGPRRADRPGRPAAGRGPAGEARPGPPPKVAAHRGRDRGRGGTISPWPGVWRSVGWLAGRGWFAAIGESETRPADLWLLPVPGVAPDGVGRAR